MPQQPMPPAGAQRRPMPPPHMQMQAALLALPKILRIGIIQGGKIVEERLVRKRDNVTVGQSTKNTFVVPTEALPRSFLLFEVTGPTYSLNFTDGMDGRVSLGDQVLSLADIKQQGRAHRRGMIWHLPLNDKSRGKVVVGDATILFQFVSPPPPQPRPQLPPSVRGSIAQSMDWALIAILGLSLLGHFGFIAYLRTVDWARKPNLEDVPDRFVSMIVKDKPLIIEKKVEIEQPGVGEEEKKKGGGDGKKAGPKGPQKSAEDLAREAAERRARLAEQVSRMGVLKILGSKGEDGNVADVLKGGDPGGDQEKAFAEIGGVGVAKGGEGAGLRGIKGGTGGTGKSVGIGGLRAAGVGEGGTGVKGPERAVRGVVRAEAAPDVDGSLDPSIVAKEVRQRLGAIKACYERALKRNPQLGGKIMVRFEISQVGKVTRVESEQDTVGDPEVFACIRQTMSMWHFTAPSGGSVQVAYPFIFQAAQ